MDKIPENEGNSSFIEDGADTAREICENCKFKASNRSWEKFSRRNNLSVRRVTRIAQIVPNDFEEVVNKISFHFN